MLNRIERQIYYEMGAAVGIRLTSSTRQSELYVIQARTNPPASRTIFNHQPETRPVDLLVAIAVTVDPRAAVQMVDFEFLFNFRSGLAIVYLN